MSPSEVRPRSRIGAPAYAVVAAVLILVTSGCYRVRSELHVAPAPPGDLYRCLQLELGRAGYAIVGADRESGWLHAQKRVERLLETSRAEIYATVIPDEDTGGSHLQLTDNTYAADDAESIRATCVPG